MTVAPKGRRSRRRTFQLTSSRVKKADDTCVEKYISMIRNESRDYNLCGIQPKKRQILVNGIARTQTGTLEAQDHVEEGGSFTT